MNIPSALRAFLATHRNLLLLALLTAALLWWAKAYRIAEPRPALAGERAQLEHERRADSAAAFTAGRLYQQRLDADKLRQTDETHDKSRPATGPIELPDFYPSR